jgi:hypothetical protein
LLQRLLDLSKSLAPSGSLVILEPALRETSRVLHGLRDQLVARSQSPFVFAPCLHTSHCPMLARERDFCHERLPCDLPDSWAQLASSAGLRERDLTYSYLTLTASRRSLAELGSGDVYRAVSGQLKSKGKTEVWLCGMGGGPRAQRLDRHATENNADIEAAERGCVIEVSHAPAPTASGLMRIEKSTEVRLLQRWAREP